MLCRRSLILEVSKAARRPSSRAVGWGLEVTGTSVNQGRRLAFGGDRMMGPCFGLQEGSEETDQRSQVPVTVYLNFRSLDHVRMTGGNRPDGWLAKAPGASCLLRYAGGACQLDDEARHWKRATPR